MGNKQVITKDDATGVVSPALAAGDLGLMFVRKTADEAVTSSATQQNDDHLFLALAINSTYIFDLVIFYDGATTGDITHGFSIPAGATLRWGETALLSSAADPSGTLNATAATGTG